MAGKQQPYPIKGTVTFTNTRSGTKAAVQGAIVWAYDTTEGTHATDAVPGDNKKIFYTRENGQYIIDLANITSAWANGDVVKVYCKYGDIFDWTLHTVDRNKGFGTVNFAFERMSGLKDGLDNDTDPKRRFGLRQMGDRGLRKGLKDGMT